MGLLPAWPQAESSESMSAAGSALKYEPPEANWPERPGVFGEGGAEPGPPTGARAAGRSGSC